VNSLQIKEIKFQMDLFGMHLTPARQLCEKLSRLVCALWSLLPVELSLTCTLVLVCFVCLLSQPMTVRAGVSGGSGFVVEAQTPILAAAASASQFPSAVVEPRF
jgi:hypothetical protein